PALLIAAAIFPSVFPLHSQERTAPARYQVELDVRSDNDGTGQRFTMLVEESRKGVFKSTDRVPLQAGSPDHVDVGVNIECTVHESNGSVTLLADIELSRITGYVIMGAISQPIIGQRKIAFEKSLELGTPTVVADGRNAAASSAP